MPMICQQKYSVVSGHTSEISDLSDKAALIVDSELSDAQNWRVTKSVGDVLKEVREAAGLTQEELAGAAKVNPETVSNAETGTANTRVDKLLAMARALHLKSGLNLFYAIGEECVVLLGAGVRATQNDGRAHANYTERSNIDDSVELGQDPERTTSTNTPSAEDTRSIWEGSAMTTEEKSVLGNLHSFDLNPRLRRRFAVEADLLATRLKSLSATEAPPGKSRHRRRVR